VLAGVSMRSAMMALGGIAFAAVAGAQALVQVTQTSNPRLALMVDGGNPLALAADADRRWRVAPGNAAVRAQVEAEAQRSLEAMPLNPRALRLKGFATEARDTTGRARSLLTLADRMTRRDVETQLWLIEDSVRAERVDQTLVHYDTALRTNPRIGAVLYPILGNAIADPEIQRAMAPYLRPPAPWVVGFVRASTESGTELGALSKTLARYGQVPAQSLQSQLLNALITAGLYEEAALYFRSMPGATPQILQGVAFDQAHTNPVFVPLAWQPLANETVSVALEPGGPGKRRYHIAIGPEESVAALHKVLILPAGAYRLDILQSFATRPADAKVAWQLVCLAAPAASKPIFGIVDTRERTAATFTVPTGCKAQELSMSVASGASDAGLDFYVDGLTLTPAAGQASAPQ
jgi:hypothetical protein